MSTSRFGAGGIFVNEDFFLVIGGQDNNDATNKCLKDGEYYNTKLPGDDWEKFNQDMPTNRANFGVAYSNDILYVMGGHGNGEGDEKGEALKDLRSLKISKNACEKDGEADWETLNPMNNERSHFACVSYDEFIYVFGGSDGKALDSAEKYNIRSNEWTKLEDMPDKRQGCAAGIIDEKIYVVGGQDQNGNILRKTIVFNTVKDVWETEPVSMMKFQRKNLSIVVKDSNLLAIGGGNTNSTETSGTKNEMLDINNLNDGWITVSTQNSTSRSSASVAIGGNEKIIAVGGKDDNSDKDATIRFDALKEGYEYREHEYQCKIKKLDYSGREYERKIKALEKEIDANQPKSMWRWPDNNSKQKTKKEKLKDIYRQTEAGEKLSDTDKHFLKTLYAQKNLTTCLLQLDVERGDDEKAKVNNSLVDWEKLKEVIEFFESEEKVKKSTRTLAFKKGIFKFWSGALLSYCILLVWVGSTLYFIIQIFLLDCRNAMQPLDGDMTILEDAMNNTSFSFFSDDDDPTDPTDRGEEMEECIDLFASDIGFVHNITFGLITAAVVAQLGTTDKMSGETLYERFEPYMNAYRTEIDVKKLELKEKRKRKYKTNFYIFRLTCRLYLCQFVIWSARFYVLVWIIFGLICLGIGSLIGEIASGPLYNTGQTWLGVSITTTYIYFGINEKTDSTFSSDASRESVLAIVASKGMALQYASMELKADRDIVKAAVNNDGMALQYASEELKNDESIVLEAVKSKGMALQYASEDMKKNQNIIKAATEQNNGAYIFIDYKEAEQKNEFIADVTKDGMNLRRAPEALRCARDVVLAAVKNKGMALRYASDELRKDKDVVLAAVKNNGMALRWASETLQNNEDVVLAAVEINGMALRYASDDLREDKDVVLAAVENNGMALIYALKTLQDNKDVVLAAVKDNNMALTYASAALQSNEEVKKAAEGKDTG